MNARNTSACPQTVVDRASAVKPCAPCCRLVLNSITKMDGARKCYQLVGGVLVEKTIETVIPDVTFNKDRVRTLV